MPQVASSGSDRKLTGGPKLAIAAATDRSGTVWVGTEDQGVWAYQAGDNWQQFTTADGLADTDATAIVADRLGRVWVGHPDHGLSVYNGQAWRTYNRFAGPGASHIFCLATCPTDGDVWMGTDAGLARYSLKGDQLDDVRPLHRRAGGAGHLPGVRLGRARSTPASAPRGSASPAPPTGTSSGQR